MLRVLLKVLVEDVHQILGDVVIKMGPKSDGEGRSWTMPIYIFNSEILSARPSDEDDPLRTMGILTPSMALFSLVSSSSSLD
jgi:hypothetical protein